MCRTYLTYLQNTCKPGGAGEINRNDLFFFFFMVQITFNYVTFL